MFIKPILPGVQFFTSIVSFRRHSPINEAICVNCHFLLYLQGLPRRRAALTRSHVLVIQHNAFAAIIKNLSELTEKRFALCFIILNVVNQRAIDCFDRGLEIFDTFRDGSVQKTNAIIVKAIKNSVMKNLSWVFLLPRQSLITQTTQNSSNVLVAATLHIDFTQQHSSISECLSHRCGEKNLILKFTIRSSFLTNRAALQRKTLTLKNHTTKISICLQTIDIISAVEQKTNPFLLLL